MRTNENRKLIGTNQWSSRVVGISITQCFHKLTISAELIGQEPVCGDDGRSLTHKKKFVKFQNVADYIQTHPYSTSLRVNGMELR